MQVGFQFPTYVGMESVGEVRVCAVLSAVTAIVRSVAVELTATAGSANGIRL